MVLPEILHALPATSRTFFDGQYDRDIPQQKLEKAFLEDLENQLRTSNYLTLEKPDGILVGHNMQWDSDYFGFPFFRLDHLFTANPDTAKVLVKEFMQQLKIEGVKYVFARTAASDTHFQNALTKVGFQLILHKIMLRCDLQKNGSISGKKTDPNLEVRTFKTENETFVTEIAAAALMTSRFSLDPKINAELTAGMYRNWAKNLVKNQPENIKIAFYNGQPAGMVACSEANDLYGKGKFPEYPMGFISLVAVDENFRGKAVGQALISEALTDYQSRNYKVVFANTALQNAGSLGMFQKAGFSVFSMVSEYRCWL